MSAVERRAGVARAVAATVAALLGLAGTTTSAGAKGGETEGWGNDFYLSSSFGSQADTVFTYGAIADYHWVGDWDGDGVDTLGYRTAGSSVIYIRNSNTGGGPELSFSYGRPGDELLVGDWDGDGVDTLAVRRGNVYHVKNSLIAGAADLVVPYGREDDTVLVGDWDGDGTDTFAVRRGAAYYVANSIRPGPADQVVAYGRNRDRVYAGDFDGDGKDSFTVRRGATYYIANTVRHGPADRIVVYGRPTDGALIGDWNGDGVDSLGIQRLDSAFERIPNGWATDISGADLRATRYDVRNGRLSHSVLCPLPFLPTHAVHCSAINGLVGLNRAYEGRFGEPLPINPAPYTTYRSYADQLHVWHETGPPTAARPGTSPHGWGLSIDLGTDQVELEFGKEPYEWLHANAPRYGWRNQPWNQEGGVNPEPWHFDFVG